jgi:RNA polymerase sigma-70 factor (ECF subfamily)
LKVHQAISTYRGDASPKSWIYRIAVNRCIDWQKQQKRRQLISMSDDMNDTYFSETRPEANPERMQINQHIRSEIAKAIENLSPAEQAVFVLRHENGFTIKHIAETTDRAEGTVKNILFRATQKLRDQLAPTMAKAKQEAL